MSIRGRELLHCKGLTLPVLFEIRGIKEERFDLQPSYTSIIFGRVYSNGFTFKMKIKSINFTAQVVIGLILGVAVGIFFGEYCKCLEPIGRVFIMLLEAFLYPFLVCSLLHGIGKLAPKSFISLIRRGWAFYLLAWLVTAALLGILVQALPAVTPLIIDPHHVSDSVSQFLVLFVPNNVFLDFTNNYIPAIVVFSIFLGLALQRFDNKKPALDVFDAISKSSVRVWKGIIKFSPVAVFALFANLSGTVSIAQLDSLMAYLLLFALASLVLTFWIMPGLISAFIDYPITLILKRMRSGIFMAAATMLPITSIPYILNVTGELAREREIDGEEREGLKETILSFSYPLVQLGNLFIYLFIGFCAFYYKHPLSLSQEILLPILSLLSTFGTPVATVNATSFLTSWLGISQNCTELYVELMTITRYFQVIATSAGLYFITIVVTFAYYKRIRFKPARIVIHLVLPVLLLALTAYGLFEIENHRRFKREKPYLRLSLPMDVCRGVSATVHTQRNSLGDAPDVRADSGGVGSNFIQIQRRGVLRIGYNAAPVPFTYFNDKGELVGYDVAFAYDLAKTLNVNLVFEPFTWKSLIGDLQANRFDIAISGTYVTEERIKDLSVSNPYFKSSVVMVTRSNQSKLFYTRQSIAAIKGLRIGVFNDNVLLNFIREAFPKAEPVFVSNFDEMLSFENFDCLIWTREQAAILASMKPGLSVVMTQDLHWPFLFAYMMPPGADEFREYINYWLELRRGDGFADRMKAYWIDGKTKAEPVPRWCIIRNILHWVD